MGLLDGILTWCTRLEWSLIWHRIGLIFAFTKGNAGSQIDNEGRRMQADREIYIGYNRYIVYNWPGTVIDEYTICYGGDVLGHFFDMSPRIWSNSCRNSVIS